MVDGIDVRSNTAQDFGAGQEVDIRTFGNSAEHTAPGAVFNIVTKSGGNDLHGSFQEQYISGKLQSTNLDDELKSQGVSSGDAIQFYNDVGGDLGGRIVRDKLWYYGDLRDRRNEITILGSQPTRRRRPVTAPVTRRRTIPRPKSELRRQADLPGDAEIPVRRLLRRHLPGERRREQPRHRPSSGAVRERSVSNLRSVELARRDARDAAQRHAAERAGRARLVHRRLHGHAVGQQQPQPHEPHGSGDRHSDGRRHGHGEFARSRTPRTLRHPGQPDLRAGLGHPRRTTRSRPVIAATCSRCSTTPGWSGPPPATTCSSTIGSAALPSSR